MLNGFTKKEKRNAALSVRLPISTLKKIKKISKKFNYSQSEVIEKLVANAWNDIEVKKENNDKK